MPAKLALFVLGFVTGTLSAYLFLTRVWWPDVRLPGRTTAQAPTTTPQLPLPTPAVTPPAPLPEPSPATTLSPEEFATPTPVVPEPTPTPLVGASPSATAPPESQSVELPLLKTDLEQLRERKLLIPVQGIDQKSLRDSFTDNRGGRHHEAIDIMAARGTPVLAIDDGKIEKLFTSKPGGLTVYQFDPKGEYCYYYAHLDSYAPSLVAGKMMKKGEIIGYVGTTGNSAPDAPHLHFTIFRLGPEKRWWEGTALNAYLLWGAVKAP